MLRALVVLRSRRAVKLAILGEGPERPSLETLIAELGLSDDVRLLGFQTNPYAYMARAAGFVLSSLWEGFPNVLVEALACGCRVVSTDCPSGPAEILDGGRFGYLVPMGDITALANGMAAVLDGPCRPEQLLKRAAEYSLDKIAGQYLDYLFNKATCSR
jgi:glycosyltransferase involved in cell wall biosynthesis